VSSNVHSPQETIWVQEAATGDARAFARLVDGYWDRIRRWLFGMTGRMQLAEDVAQETFLKAWIALPHLRDAGTFRVWLFQIARRCWADARRRSKAARKVPLAPEMPDCQRGPLGELIDSETLEQLELSLELLPSKFRAAYLLWNQQELAYGEIAQILGITEETARWRVCKARKTLLKLMTEYLQRG
jgi:RNA polymerase sigma-70 factor (ECF subfamily)